MTFKRPENATCETCPYWDRPAPTADHGDCQRLVPRFARFANTQYAEYIEQYTRVSDWCGEHPLIKLAEARWLREQMEEGK